MEIPTNTHGDIHYAEIIIEKQRLEILELQMTICRLKEEHQKQYQETFSIRLWRNPKEPQSSSSNNLGFHFCWIAVHYTVIPHFIPGGKSAILRGHCRSVFGYGISY